MPAGLGDTLVSAAYMVLCTRRRFSLPQGVMCRGSRRPRVAKYQPTRRAVGVVQGCVCCVCLAFSSPSILASVVTCSVHLHRCVACVCVATPFGVFCILALLGVHVKLSVYVCVHCPRTGYRRTLRGPLPTLAGRSAGQSWIRFCSTYEKEELALGSLSLL